MTALEQELAAWFQAKGLKPSQANRAMVGLLADNIARAARDEQDARHGARLYCNALLVETVFAYLIK